MQNKTNGTLARATMAVRSESGSSDLTMLATSTAYTTAGGIPALTTAIVSGAGATGGLVIQTGAGNLWLQIGGTSNLFAFTPGGVLQIAGLTTNAFIYPGASGGLTSTAAASNGQLLIGSTAAPPVLAALTGSTDQVIVTNGAGSIVLSLPQSINTSSTPTFAGLSLSTALGIASGGTAAATAGSARTNLGAAAAGAPGAHTTTLAKITGGGANGSLTWNADGCVTAFADPT